jgi:hypothetical protein
MLGVVILNGDVLSVMVLHSHTARKNKVPEKLARGKHSFLFSDGEKKFYNIDT